MKGTVEIVEDLDEETLKSRTIVVKQAQDINKIFKNKATVPLANMSTKTSNESCLFKLPDKSLQLNQKLIEVLETEENLSENA